MRKALLWASVLFLGCADRTEPVRIGLAGPLTTRAGAAMRLAAELAINEINASGGVGGRPLELVLGDDGGFPDSAAAVAGRLRDAEVVAVVGHGGITATAAAATVYAEAAPLVPLLVPSVASAALREAGPNVFRLAATTVEHGSALATWAMRGRGWQRGAVVYRNDPYGRSVRQSFTDRFEAIGGGVVAAFPFLPDEGVGLAYLDWLRDTEGVDFLMFAGGSAEAERLLALLRGDQLQLPVLGPESLEGLESLGPIAEGVTWSATYLPSQPAADNQRFVAAYRDANPDQDAPTTLAATTYDAVHLLRALLVEAGTSRAALLQALARTGNELPPFQGVTGVIGFDARGGLAPRPMQLVTLHDGAIVPVDRR